MPFYLRSVGHRVAKKPSTTAQEIQKAVMFILFSDARKLVESQCRVAALLWRWTFKGLFHQVQAISGITSLFTDTFRQSFVCLNNGVEVVPLNVLCLAVSSDLMVNSAECELVF